jgi:hypothetical protein
MTAKAAWKLGYITDEEWRQYKAEMKHRQLGRDEAEGN